MKLPLQHLNTFVVRDFDCPLAEAEDDEDIVDFQRELKIADPDDVRKELTRTLPWDGEHGMWVLVEYNDYHGSLADRANAEYYLSRYPNAVTVKADSRFNHVVTGVTEVNTLNFDTDILFSLLQDFDRANKQGALDQAKWRELQQQAKIKAWEHWMQGNFFDQLMLKFPDQEAALVALTRTSRFYQLFEQARDASGEEWIEHPGTEMTAFIEPIVNAVTPQMLQRFLGQDLPPQQESLMESKSFSCVLAPAPPEIADAVIRWGQMFVTDDELYEPESDPDGFGRETDVHVTVKFGLNDAEPEPELLRIIEETQPFEIEIGPCTLFENEEFDVVKFDVDGDGLRELNARISELPNGDTHPDYRPHMTVAYVTKGACHDLIGKPLLEPELPDDIRFLVKTVTFSRKSGRKLTLFLGKPNLEPQPVDSSVL